jgi:F-type H+-transporting ATPase subunit alpha
MQLNPSEISDLIKQKIEQFDLKTEARAEGTIVSVTDGIVRIYGLSDAQYYEMLEFPNNTFGLALNLERDSVGAVVLGDYTACRRATGCAAPAACWRCRWARA